MSYINVHHTDSDKRDPLAPQSLVVANGNVDPDLVKERQRNHSTKYPLIDPSTDLGVRRGEWFFSRIDANPRRHRHAQMNLDDIIGFTSASGMLGWEKFVFRGCVDYPGEQADPDGSATPRFGLSMRVVGNATGWNTGMAPIKQGDMVYADWPDVKVDAASGMVLPHWQPDWNPTKFYFATKPMSPHTIAGAVLRFFRMLADALDDELVCDVASRAYKACTPFPDMQGDADPMKRFSNFFNNVATLKTKKMSDLRKFESKLALVSDNNEIEEADEVLMKAFADNVLYSKELREEGRSLDQIFAKSDIPTYSDNISPQQFQAFRGGAVTFISELEALHQARYMGVALANSQPGGPLDLLLH